MQLTCPVCGARCSIEAHLSDESARRTMAAALKMPAQLGDLTLRYLGLFRSRNRALAWDRAECLLADLLAPIERGQLERRGRTWAAPMDYWRRALEQMLAGRDKLTLPLKSHGYLFEIVVGLADGAESKSEARMEQDRQTGQARTETVPAAAPKAIRDYLARHGLRPESETKG